MSGRHCIIIGELTISRALQNKPPTPEPRPLVVRMNATRCLCVLYITPLPVLPFSLS